jgi:hypothetical protein
LLAPSATNGRDSPSVQARPAITAMQRLLQLSLIFSLFNTLFASYPASTYTLVKDFQAGTSSFFNNFNFYSGADPTNGFVKSASPLRIADPKVFKPHRCAKCRHALDLERRFVFQLRLVGCGPEWSAKCPT